jgi:hypothetical protein
MKYLVIKRFRDKYTKELYKVGEIYETNSLDRAKYLQKKAALGDQIAEPEIPEQSTKVHEEAQELDSEPARELEPEPEPEPQLKHIGGGWYELPGGERIKGKEAALNALPKLPEHVSQDGDSR